MVFALAIELDFGLAIELYFALAIELYFAQKALFFFLPDDRNWNNQATWKFLVLLNGLNLLFFLRDGRSDRLVMVRMVPGGCELIGSSLQRGNFLIFLLDSHKLFAEMRHISIRLLFAHITRTDGS